MFLIARHKQLICSQIPNEMLKQKLNNYCQCFEHQSVNMFDKYTHVQKSLRFLISFPFMCSKYLQTSHHEKGRQECLRIRDVACVAMDMGLRMGTLMQTQGWAGACAWAL
jgi:hypothetical protein